MTTMVTTMDRTETEYETDEGKELTRRLVTPGDPDEPYPTPFFTTDFDEAPDLERIGTALIAACDEFEDIRWAIEEEALAISWVWKKKGAKADGKVRTGALAKTGGMVKHFSGATYVIGLSRDANAIRTRWQVEAEVYHQLTHIRVERAVVGKGDDKTTVPVFKKRPHDLEMFDAEIGRYGLWRHDLKRTARTFAQLGLDGMGR